MSAKIQSQVENQYEYLSSEYIVTDTSGSLESVCHKANNLYNAALYQFRQSWLKRGIWLKYEDLDYIFKVKCKSRELMLYHQFPYVHIAQQTLRELSTVCGAWIKALNAYNVCPQKFTGRPRIPHYLEKGKQHTAFLTNSCFKIQNGYLVIKRMGFTLKLRNGIDDIRRVAIKPYSKGRYKIILQYKTNKEIQYKPDNGIYIGVDPGVDNAFVCVTNGNAYPLILNGRGAKSVNQYYNKRRAELASLHAKYNQCGEDVKTTLGMRTVYHESNAMKQLTVWRNEKLYQFAHKVSRCVVEYASICNATAIVIGHNKFWKQKSSMGKKTNQKFVCIPHDIMIEMIKYKANLEGIRVIVTEESYTSQTSFLDAEQPCEQNGNYSRRLQGKSFINRRIHRGLFMSDSSVCINADVNGAFQILRKVFPNVTANGIVGLVLNPVKYSVDF